MTAAGQRSASKGEQRWSGLNAAQAEGTECVMCEVSFVWPEVPAQHRLAPVPGTRTGPSGVPSVPVGIADETGSQVFACLGICAALAFPD